MDACAPRLMPDVRWPSAESMKRSIVINELASAIAAVRVHHPTRVAIDGVDGVGKTKLADELVEPVVSEPSTRDTERAIISSSFVGMTRTVTRLASAEIGKREADAVALQEDMSVAAGVRDTGNPASCRALLRAAEQS